MKTKQDPYDHMLSSSYFPNSFLSELSLLKGLYPFIIPCFHLLPLKVQKNDYLFHDFTGTALMKLTSNIFLAKCKVLFQFCFYLDFFSPFILLSNPSKGVELLLKFILFPTNLFCLHFSHHFSLSLFQVFPFFFASTWCWPGLSPWSFPLFILPSSWVVSFPQRILMSPDPHL